MALVRLTTRIAVRTKHVCYASHSVRPAQARRSDCPDEAGWACGFSIGTLGDHTVMFETEGFASVADAEAYAERVFERLRR